MFSAKRIKSDDKNRVFAVLTTSKYITRKTLNDLPMTEKPGAYSIGLLTYITTRIHGEGGCDPEGYVLGGF